MDDQEQDQQSSSSAPTSSNWGAVKVKSHNLIF